MTIPVLTKHATERLAERFPEIDLEREFSAALPFGMQRGNSQVRLSPCGAVFVVADGVVVTVMTKRQAIANFSGKIRVSLPNVAIEKPSQPVVRQKVKKPDLQAERSQRVRERIIELAEEHYAADPMAITRQSELLAIVKAEIESMGELFGQKRKDIYLGRLLWLTNQPREAKA